MLAFVPVPWPDDSAFYFVAKDLFTWPPQWVMLSQAPFEPTYKIFNFNTMPLYPILLGIGRFIGIDGSFAIKFWPLLFWTLSGVLIGFVFYKKKLPFVLCFLIVLLFTLDPIHRWASVLVRPESFVGLCGLAMVLGLSFGFPDKLKAKGIWDPVSCLLALAAYAHFNAIHLLFPAAFSLANQSLKNISKTAGKTVLYLTPWLITVMMHYDLFIIQMHTQWTRLAIQNDWVKKKKKALSSLFQDMGAPTTWHLSLQIVSWIIWIFIGLSLILGIIIPAFITQKQDPKLPALPPASGWILGAIWLWSSKPEVWFIYFLHISVWTFVGILIFRLWMQQKKLIYKVSLMGILCLLLPNHFIFVYATYDQYRQMHKSRSWNWTTYYDLIDCVERRLNKLEVTLNYPKPFRIWDPTFP
ncbi:MAG: hypothetical protein HY072_05170, partial [Deltaproteobacteria bacterium]|nr:hypothetical protein [Deltaproteobacteria bacterium]